MILIFDKEKVIRGLQKAANISAQKSGTTFLKTVWLKWNNQKLHILATDSKIEFVGEYSIKSEGEGIIGVNGKSFYELIKKLPPGEITISLAYDGEYINLEQGSKKYKITTYDSSWFREFIEFPNKGYVKWYGDSLKEIINRLYYFIPDDVSEDNKYLNLCKSKNSNDIVAYGIILHSFAMLTFEHTELYQLFDDNLYLIDKMFLNELRKWLENNEIYLTINENRIFIKDEINNEKISFPIITKQENDYNVYLEVFKDNNLSTLIVNKNELIDVLERISVFASDIDELVTFAFSNNRLLIHSESHDKGEATEELLVNYSGELESVLFLIKRTKQIIEHFESENIKFEFTTFDGPCKITGLDESDKGYIVITMPVRLKEEKYYEDEVVESYE